MSARVEAMTIHKAGNGYLRPVEEAPSVTSSLLRTDKVVSTEAQVVPTGFFSERVYPQLSIEKARRAKLSILSNATAVHDAEGTVGRLLTTYGENGERTTQYLATQDGIEKFREVVTHPDGGKVETINDSILDSISGAWVVVRNTYGPEHMMYMYLKEDADGLPGLPQEIRPLYLEQQVNELERLQRLDENGEEDGLLRSVKMGLNRSFSVEDKGLRSVYRLHIHAWRNERNLSPEQAIDERNKQEGYDGGISTHLGEQIAHEIAPAVGNYWEGAVVYYDEMGPSVWLPGFTPRHLIDNGQGNDVIDGLMAPVDRAVDKQLDRVHRTAYASERSDVQAYVKQSCDSEVFSEAKFSEFFTPRTREETALDGKYIDDPDIAAQIEAYRDAGKLRRPAGAAIGIEFIPGGLDLGPAGAHVRLSTAVTSGCVGTLEVTDVAELDRRPDVLPPDTVKEKVRGLYDRLIIIPPVAGLSEPTEVFSRKV